MEPRWDRIQDLFISAGDLPAAERAAFLDEACGTDIELRAEVDSLLAAMNGADSFVQNAIGRVATSLSGDSGVKQSQMVGAYRILGEIGRGGMGTVYLAERADQQYRK